VDRALTVRGPVEEPAAGPVIVFDGICALCSRWVRFLLRVDTRGRYRFAAMQGGRHYRTRFP